MSRGVRDVVAAAADLAFGSRCAGCDEVPGTLCDACVEVLHGPASEGELPVDLDAGTPAGPPMPVAVTARYDGVGRAVIIAHKERGRLALAKPLGAALAVAVTAVLVSADGAPPAGADAARSGADAARSGAAGVLLVPAPSSRSATRARGHDPMLRTARHAAAVLRRVGVPASVAPALVYRRAVSDQHGLGRDARLNNVRDAITVRRRRVARLRRARVVIVDDVVTTGATVTECRRALCAAGVPPLGAAAVTAVGAFAR